MSIVCLFPVFKNLLLRSFIDIQITDRQNVNIPIVDKNVDITYFPNLT
jgi:hypothetical protein